MLPKKMMLLLLSLLCTAQADPSPEAQAAERPPASAVVRLYVSTSRPLAMLTVGDGPPSPVAFDTGTDDNILKPAFAAGLGLKPAGTGPLTDAATGRTTQVPLVAIPEARLGGVPIESRTAQLLDYPLPDEVGIFGPASFGDDYVVLEAGLNRLRIVPKSLGDAPPGPGTLYVDGLPAIPIRIDGRPFLAHLDSGNDSALILGVALIGAVRLTAPAKVVAVAQSALGRSEVKGGRLAGSVAVGPVRLTAPEVTFSPSGSMADIGFPLLRRLIVVLDPKNKRSWVLDPAVRAGPLGDYVGRFGPRAISLERGRLIYQRDGRSPYPLSYLGGDLFEMPATGDRIQFYRRNGRVARLELITAEGDVASAARDRQR